MCVCVWKVVMVSVGMCMMCNMVKCVYGMSIVCVCLWCVCPSVSMVCVSII